MLIKDQNGSNSKQIHDFLKFELGYETINNYAFFK